MIDSAADLRGDTGVGVLPMDGSVQRQLEKELEYARLEYARHYKNKGTADSQLFRVMVAACCSGFRSFTLFSSVKL